MMSATIRPCIHVCAESMKNIDLYAKHNVQRIGGAIQNGKSMNMDEKVHRVIIN